MDIYDRTGRLIGNEGVEVLKNSKVLIVGVGGVGSYVAEAIARSGIGTVGLMDGDDVEITNFNRQLIALSDTLGRNKAEVMKERIGQINPAADVRAFGYFYEEGTDLPVSEYDFVIDAIDSLNAKTALIKKCVDEDVRVVSAMGAGGKFGVEPFKIVDLSETHTCPVAKIMRKKLKAEGIEHLPVAFSPEKSIVPAEGKPGTLSYVPASMGLLLAGYVIRELLGYN